MYSIECVWNRDAENNTFTFSFESFFLATMNCEKSDDAMWTAKVLAGCFVFGCFRLNVFWPRMTRKQLQFATFLLFRFLSSASLNFFVQNFVILSFWIHGTWINKNKLSKDHKNCLKTTKLFHLRKLFYMPVPTIKQTRLFVISQQKKILNDMKIRKVFPFSIYLSKSIFRPEFFLSTSLFN